MGFIQNLFNKNPVVTRIEMISDKGNSFYVWNGKLYKSDLIRACIRPTAKAVSKLTAQHIRNNKQEGFSVNPEPYIRFLLEEPNPFMTGQMLQEKIVTQLELNNNAFVYINRDELGYPIELYPIPAVSAEAIYDSQRNLYIKFFFINGKNATYPYEDIIHIRQDYNENDIFGDSPQTTLSPLMEIITTTDQGIVKAIKNSMVVRWIMKFKSTIRPEDRDSQIDDFVSNFLSVEKGKGVATTDNRYDLDQVKNESYVPNAAQMDRAVQRLYSFFNTNEKIIQSKYNEDEWNSFYESKVEPIAMQLSSEYTRKLFTRRERGFGNKIIFAANNLQYASMNTKMQLMQMVDRGAMTPNEWREILGLPPLANSDNPIRRLDTAVVTTNNPEEGGEEQ